MAAAHQTLAVIVPGADTSDIALASEKYSIKVAAEEVYSEQKDYERFFKPSSRLFHKHSVSLLFVFADGSAQLVQDAPALKSVLKMVTEAVSL